MKATSADIPNVFLYNIFLTPLVKRSLFSIHKKKLNESREIAPKP
jgi:hypothetical protein